MKTPKRILIISEYKSFKPGTRWTIDYSSQNTTYDLVICVGKCLRLSLDYPFSIANAEIWYERGSAFTETIFRNAIRHYAQCDIRNGL